MFSFSPLTTALIARWAHSFVPVPRRSIAVLVDSPQAPSLSAENISQAQKSLASSANATPMVSPMVDRTLFRHPDEEGEGRELRSSDPGEMPRKDGTSNRDADEDVVGVENRPRGRSHVSPTAATARQLCFFGGRGYFGADWCAKEMG